MNIWIFINYVSEWCVFSKIPPPGFVCINLTFGDSVFTTHKMFSVCCTVKMVDLFELFDVFVYLINGFECFPTIDGRCTWHCACVCARASEIFVEIVVVIAYKWHDFEYLYWNRYKLSSNIWPLIIPINRGGNKQINKYLIGWKERNREKRELPTQSIKRVSLSTSEIIIINFCILEKFRRVF